MPEFTIYDVDTGRILNSGRVGSIAQIGIQSSVNTEIVLGQELDAEKFYIIEHSPVARPRFTPIPSRTIRADGVHKTTIISLPDGTVVSFEGQETAIDDGKFEFVTAVPGVYQFLFSAPFPYQSQTVTVTADAI